MNLAQRINAMLGVRLLPWEINHIPGDWLDAMLAMLRSPKNVDAHRDFEAAKQRIRANHPTFGQRLKRKQNRIH